MWPLPMLDNYARVTYSDTIPVQKSRWRKGQATEDCSHF